MDTNSIAENQKKDEDINLEDRTAQEFSEHVIKTVEESEHITESDINQEAETITRISKKNAASITTISLTKTDLSGRVSIIS